jgi:hypothetical protein
VGEGKTASLPLRPAALADIDVQMYPVLRLFSFGNRLKEQAGAFAGRVDESNTPQLLRDALVRGKFRPSLKSFRRFLEVIAEGHRPKPRHCLDVMAVKGQLEWIGMPLTFS